MGVFSGSDLLDQLHADTGILAKCRNMIAALKKLGTQIEDDDASYTATVIGVGIFVCLLSAWAICSN